MLPVHLKYQTYDSMNADITVNHLQIDKSILHLIWNIKKI